MGKNGNNTPLQINPRDDYRVFLVDESGEVLKEITRVSTLVEGSVKDTVLFNPSIFETVTIKSHFVKLNEVVFTSLDENLDKVSRLLPYVGYMNGVLTYANNKRVSSDLSIGKLCGVGKNNSTKYTKSLINEDIIHKHTGDGTTYYTFNPFICLRGDKATIDLFTEFEDSKWRFINSGEIDKSKGAVNCGKR